MDHDKPGLFSLLLQNAFDEAIHVDVVKIKRKKIVLRLNLLKDALEHKDYEKANFLLLDICDMVLNDPYADEYNMNNVQVDMVVFSSAVTNVSVKYYDRTQQIITSLIMKYRNPIFYYVLGVSYFYKLCFQEAKEQFNLVINLLENQKNAMFLWPDTNILIITTTTENIRENALCFLHLITLIEDVKSSKSGKKVKQATIEISSTIHSNIDFNVGIGKYIQNEIYPYIQNMLNDLTKFDKWKLPLDYQRIVTKLYKPLKFGESSASRKKVITTQKSTPNQKKTTQTSVSKSDNKETGSIKDDTNKPTVISVPKKEEKKQTDHLCSVQKSDFVVTKEPEQNKTNVQKIVVKSQAIQVQPVVKCKVVQTNIIKMASQYVQTVEDDSVLNEKKALILEQQETITELRRKLREASQKQRNSNKDAAELLEKNRIITEQQEIISKLRVQLNNSSIKQKDIELKLNKANAQINEMNKTNKTILTELEKYKESCAELRNYNQILEKSAKNVGKDREETKTICKNLFRKYKDSYSMQIQFYENFQRRCETVLSVLNNISNYLTEITVPTKEDCQTSISEWLSAMLSCTEALQLSKKHIQKCDKVNTEEILFDFSNIAPLLPIKEPADILSVNVPILIYTIKDYETMLQNRIKKAKSDNSKNEYTKKNGFIQETDYRKKSNFIHKVEENSPRSNEPHTFMFDKSSPQHQKQQQPESHNKIFSTTHGTLTKDTEQTYPDIGSKKMRSLILYLKKNIPDKTESEITEALNSYRKQNNGSLSGITLHFILYNVLAILESPKTAYTTVKTTYKDLDTSNNDDMCPICIEPISMKEKSVLTCNHVYHTECIRKWLSRNRVCAVCRMYTVLDEDFPPLKT